MTLLLQSISAPILVLLTALGYALATVGMKLTAQGLGTLGLALAATGLITAFVFEVALLRRTDLSIVYIGIVIAETMLVLGYATWINEGLTLRQMGGAAMVLAGLAAIST